MNEWIGNGNGGTYLCMSVVRFLMQMEARNISSTINHLPLILSHAHMCQTTHRKPKYCTKDTKEEQKRKKNRNHNNEENETLLRDQFILCGTCFSTRLR